MRTEYPLACNNAPKAAAEIPLPKEDTTPPVINIYLELCIINLC